MKQVKESTAKRKRDRHKSNMPRINTLRKSKKYRAQTHNKFRRSNKWSKFYNTKLWRELRYQKLLEQPLCEECLKRGKITSATQVHHIVEFSLGIDEQQQWELFLDYENLESICNNCHKRIHGNKHHT